MEVELAPGEMSLRPDLIVSDRGGRRMLRVLGDCAALVRDGPRWRCAVYDDRPRVCRAFEPGSPACLEVRGELGR